MGNLARRSLADNRKRTLGFGALFAFVAFIQPISYRRAYPSRLDRLAFAHSFADNKAIRLFYGVPHGLLTVGGYTAWRVGGILAVFAAVWASLAAVAAFRGEEDAGRSELVLSQVVGRRTLAGSSLLAITVAAALLWAALFFALVAAGLPAPGSAFLALAVGSVTVVFIGVGAVASQLASTRRRAVELSLGVMSLAFVLRVVADTVGGAGWLRWLTPLGWAEEMRAFASPRPFLLLLPAATGVVLVIVSVRIADRRDVGTGLLSAGDSREPKLALLSSLATQTVRSELSSLIAWLGGIGGFALIVGVISKSISAGVISRGLREQLAKLGSGSIVTPSGYIGFSFLFFVLVVSLFACSQVGAARSEEVHGRLETVLALPVGRRRWLLDRTIVAGVAIVLISLVAGVLAWVGAEAVGVGVDLTALLLAAANCIAVASLFLGVGVLCYALLPRAAAALSYGLVTVAFVWQLFGSLLGAPEWLIRLSPFEHIGLAPGQPFKLGWAIAMLVIGSTLALAAGALIGRRDIVSG